MHVCKLKRKAFDMWHDDQVYPKMMCHEMRDCQIVTNLNGINRHQICPSSLLSTWYTQSLSLFCCQRGLCNYDGQVILMVKPSMLHFSDEPFVFPREQSDRQYCKTRCSLGCAPMFKQPWSHILGPNTAWQLAQWCHQRFLCICTLNWRTL